MPELVYYWPDEVEPWFNVPAPGYVQYDWNSFEDIVLAYRELYEIWWLTEANRSHGNAITHWNNGNMLGAATAYRQVSKWLAAFIFCTRYWATESAGMDIDTFCDMIAQSQEHCPDNWNFGDWHSSRDFIMDNLNDHDETHDTMIAILEALNYG
jgi:hypothetical protein